MDDGRLLVSIRALPSCGLGQSRVGCIERNGDAPPREMTAQVATLDRMRLIDQPGAIFIGMKNQKLSAIIQTLLSQTCPEQSQRDAQRETIHLAVGELIADRESLQRDWDKLTFSTPLANTKLNIRIIPAEQQCMWCFLIYRPEQGETRCPQCRCVGARILSGEELYLEED